MKPETEKKAATLIETKCRACGQEMRFALSTLDDRPKTTTAEGEVMVLPICIDCVPALNLITEEHGGWDPEAFLAAMTWTGMHDEEEYEATGTVDNDGRDQRVADMYRELVGGSLQGNLAKWREAHSATHHILCGAHYGATLN